MIGANNLLIDERPYYVGLADDELVEVTPHNLRMRKRVLAANMRPRRET